MENKYKFLVIGGGHPCLYGDYFFEVGSHPTSNFGAGKDWRDYNLWDELISMLITENITFDGIIIDTGSFSWIEENTIELILNLFEIVLKPNGIIMLEAYRPRDKIQTYTSKNTLFYKFNELLIGTDGICPVKEFIFNKNPEDVYRIYQRLNDELIISTLGLYPYGTELVRYNSKGYIDVMCESVEEKDQKEFLLKRFVFDKLIK